MIYFNIVIIQIKSNNFDEFINQINSNKDLIIKYIDNSLNIIKTKQLNNDITNYIKSIYDLLQELNILHTKINIEINDINIAILENIVNILEQIFVIIKNFGKFVLEVTSDK